MAPLSPAAVFAPRSDIPPLAAAVLMPPGRELRAGAGTETSEWDYPLVT